MTRRTPPEGRGRPGPEAAEEASGAVRFGRSPAQGRGRWCARRALVWGALAGLALEVGAAALTAHRALQAGLVIPVDSARIARSVRRQVAAEAERSLPLLMADLRRKVPPALAADMVRRLGRFSISFSGVTIELPPREQATLDRQMEAVMAHALARYLASVDTRQLARQLALAAAAEAERRLKLELFRHPVYLTPYPWLRVPVHLVDRPSH